MTAPTGAGGRAMRWAGPAHRALTCACAVLAATLLLSAAAPPAQAAANGPYAIHSMLQLNSPYGFKRAMFAEAAAAGASEIRVDVSLGALHNPWFSGAMWNGMDEYMQLSRQYSLPVLVDLNASNDLSLQSCQPGVGPSNGLCGVSDLSGYYNEVAGLVQYTRGVIDDFEIVNEPDARWAFTGTPQQYAGMLATAYQAVHDNDPNGRVLLGGIMTGADMSWVTQVFATPGYDAAHKFDIANVHIRDQLASLPGDVIAWHNFFSFFGDGSLPLWVTEAGYPSDPTYQYDPAFRGTDTTSGQLAQAGFLDKSLPTLLFAGAARVFVTERDNMTGQYASEGLLGGAVTDANESAPDPVPKPAFAVFEALVQRWQAAIAARPASAAQAATPVLTHRPTAAPPPSAPAASPGVAPHRSRAGARRKRAAKHRGRGKSRSLRGGHVRRRRSTPGDNGLVTRHRP